jgi:DNA-binding CsgD family transcriptional regulator
LINNNLSQAIEQYNLALEHLEKLQIPLLQMLIQFRLGAAYIKNNDPLNAKKFLLSANSISRNLGTRPFTVKIGEQLAFIGMKPEESRKEDSEERAEKAGLTRRQSEILELISEGLTNKEIADKLFLSTRTVDMHVSNILQRLNCRTRIDAINKARELKLI